MYNENFDHEIKKILDERVENIYVSDNLKGKIDKEIMNIENKEVFNMKHLSIKKVAIAVAAVSLFTSTAVFAGSKMTSYYVSHSSAIPEYTSFSDIEKIEKDLKWNVDAIENFSNGYTFDSIDLIDVQRVEDEDIADTFKQLSIRYKKDNSSINLIIDKYMESSTSREPDETFEYNGINFSYCTDHYKFVPADYKLTDEDIENDKKDNYYISYGSSEVEEETYSYIKWQKDGLNYSLNGFDLNNSDEIFEMAKEIVE